MNSNIKKEIIVAVLMIVVALLCLFYSMSPMMYVGVHIGAIIIFIFFAVLIWTGKSIDERDYMHRALSSDIAFTVGGVMLGIATMYQMYTSMKVDVWILVTLSTMILVRVGSQIWLEHNR